MNIDSKTLEHRVKEVVSTAFDLEPHVKKVVATAFEHYSSDNITWSLPEPQLIRAGKTGGLPFESLTTDLTLGCLPPAQICYGNCFAARAAFNAGFNFGKRVENILDEEIFLSDLDALPKSQGYLRNGWNSDPSWRWNKALRLAELINSSGRHTVFITKCFLAPDETIMRSLAALGVELRVSISAFDTKSQLDCRIKTIENYRKHKGVAIPLLMTTRFKDQSLNVKQDKIVQYVVESDLPAAENSLRFNASSPVMELIDESACRQVAESGDLWCGRLYPDTAIKIPTTTSIPPHYQGLQSPNLSENNPDFLKSLWYEPVPSHEEVKSKKSLNKPTKCGVAFAWDKVEKQVK